MIHPIIVFLNFSIIFRGVFFFLLSSLSDITVLASAKPSTTSSIQSQFIEDIIKRRTLLYKFLKDTFHYELIEFRMIGRFDLWLLCKLINKKMIDCKEVEEADALSLLGNKQLQQLLSDWTWGYSTIRPICTTQPNSKLNRNANHLNPQTLPWF